MMVYRDGRPYLPLTDKLYIKQRVLLMLERGFPNARVAVDITDDWERFGPFFEARFRENYSPDVGVRERMDLPYYYSASSEEYIRQLAYSVASRMVNFRMKDAWVHNS